LRIAIMAISGWIISPTWDLPCGGEFFVSRRGAEEAETAERVSRRVAALKMLSSSSV
jgi:hypothetical protein